MKNYNTKKYFITTVFSLIAIFGIVNFVKADSGPQPPNCAEGMISPAGGVGKWISSPITCGFLTLNVYLNLKKVERIGLSRTTRYKKR